MYDMSRYSFLFAALMAVAALLAVAADDTVGADSPSAQEIAARAVQAAEKVAEKAAAAAVEKAAKRLVDEKAEQAKAEARAKEARVDAKELRDLLDTRVFRLEHASAAEVADKLNEMWNGEFGQLWKVSKMAVPFQESNSIMVTAPRIVLDACANAVTELDVEAQQVYIEARFVELGNRASHKIGIDWTLLGGMTGTAAFGGGIQR